MIVVAVMRVTPMVVMFAQLPVVCIEEERLALVLGFYAYRDHTEWWFSEWVPRFMLSHSAPAHSDH